MKFNLDPRTKLYMAFVVSTIVMMSATTPLLQTIRMIITIIPIMLLVFEKQIRQAIIFSVLYLGSIFITRYFFSRGTTGIVANLITAYSCIIAQFIPSFITAWYLVKTTKVGAFLSAMKKLHIPDSITIPLAVVMRFFPTIKEENAYINDAMKMRGIIFGKGNLLKMVEYRIIPLIFSCMSIGEELSQAAITRGLGSNVKRTCVEKIKFSILDYCFIVFFTVVIILFLGLRLIKL